MRRTAVIVMILIATSSSAYAADTAVAVMNFVNHGGPGLDYLSKSIPESIAGSLSDIKGIKVVEREHLGKLLDEIALEQTGIIDTKDVYRTGKLAKADVLILGSIGGDPGNVIVTMKAVQVATGKVLAGKLLKSPVASLFDKAVMAARSMGAVVSGQGVAKISVSSTPSGATVYIDGAEAGNTPLVEYAVVAGEHEVKVVRDGFMDYEQTVNVAANAHERLNPILVESRMIHRNDVGIGVYYLMPLHDDIQGTPLYSLFYAHAFGWLQPGVELSFAVEQHHDMDLTSPLGTPFTMDRYYGLLMFHAYLNFIPFPRWRHVLPYGGVMVGLVRSWDYRVNETRDNDDEIVASMTRFSLGGRIGVSFVPFSTFSVFLEARFLWQPMPIDRPTYVSQGLGGEMLKVADRTALNYLAFGGGFKFVF